MRIIPGVLLSAVLLATAAFRWVPPAADSGARIAVANFNSSGSNGGNIETFALKANGNREPLTTIAGSATGIINPGTVALDAAGDVVTLHSGQVFDLHPGISVFAQGATGNVAPSHLIVDSEKKHELRLVAADGSGNVYALFLEPNGNASGIDVFPPGADGVTKPVRTIAGPDTLLDQPLTVIEFYVGVKGDIWWMCDGEVGPPILVEYAPGANGDVAPVATLPLEPNGVPRFAVNDAGVAYVTQFVSSAAVTQVYPNIAKSSTPSRTYTVDCSINCSVAAARGTQGIFLTNQGVSPSAIIMYDLSGPSGELHAVRAISGRKTLLDNPLSAAVR